MDFKEIKKIVELMDEHGLSQFKLEQDETKLELKKGGDVDMQAIQQLMASAPAPQYAAPAPAPAVGAAAPAAAVGPAGLPAGVEEITSPMVGTFYAAPSPDSDDFVKVGSKVSADTPVCIVEAMKVMNEIQAEVSGEIVEILIESGTAVQYGEALFRVKTS
ncbi:acetyl-CoA carboxylase biotin carboxyl carrier protein [Verrucomicrobiales bacterium BCK34]|nr:acetyl-CoA carboxylase biotin carboxyl carrier protein [Verrucomicrobiales bacterium BCK34]